MIATATKAAKIDLIKTGNLLFTKNKSFSGIISSLKLTSLATLSKVAPEVYQFICEIDNVDSWIRVYKESAHVWYIRVIPTQGVSNPNVRVFLSHGTWRCSVRRSENYVPKIYESVWNKEPLSFSLINTIIRAFKELNEFDVTSSAAQLLLQKGDVHVAASPFFSKESYEKYDPIRAYIIDKLKLGDYHCQQVELLAGRYGYLANFLANYITLHHAKNYYMFPSDRFDILKQTCLLTYDAFRHKENSALILVESPVKVTLKDNYLLHNLDGYAVTFADSNGYAFMYGIQIPYKYARYHRHLWQASWLMTEKSIPIRAVLWKEIPIERIVQQSHCRVLHENKQTKESLVTVNGFNEIVYVYIEHDIKRYTRVDSKTNTLEKVRERWLRQ